MRRTQEQWLEYFSCDEPTFTAALALDTVKHTVIDDVILIWRFYRRRIRRYVRSQ